MGERWYSGCKTCGEWCGELETVNSEVGGGGVNGVDGGEELGVVVVVVRCDHGLSALMHPAAPRLSLAFNS